MKPPMAACFRHPDFGRGRRIPFRLWLLAMSLGLGGQEPARHESALPPSATTSHSDVPPPPANEIKFGTPAVAVSRTGDGTAAAVRIGLPIGRCDPNKVLTGVSASFVAADGRRGPLGDSARVARRRTIPKIFPRIRMDPSDISRDASGQCTMSIRMEIEAIDRDSRHRPLPRRAKVQVGVQSLDPLYDMRADIVVNLQEVSNPISNGVEGSIPRAPPEG